MPSSKPHVGVVFGGASSEHDVSIKSAATVINALRAKNNASRFTVKLVYIDQQGRWWSENIAQKALEKGYGLKERELPKPLPKKGLMYVGAQSARFRLRCLASTKKTFLNIITKKTISHLRARQPLFLI